MSEYKDRTTLNDWLTQSAVDPNEDEEIVCPVGDPDCTGTDEQCHDACVPPYDDYPPEPDDSVKCCPECEAPNQFGELCARCRRAIEMEARP